MPGRARLAEILLVEDNQGDLLLMQEALEDTGLLLNLSVARDGQEALDHLFRVEGFEDAPRPDLILLDWNLPKVNGEEVLAAVKNSDELRQTPVVILTSSQAQEDILRSYNLHANCFISKPLDFDKFMEIVSAIGGFWFSIVQLPPNEQS